VICFLEIYLPAMIIVSASPSRKSRSASRLSFSFEAAIKYEEILIISQLLSGWSCSRIVLTSGTETSVCFKLEITH